MSMLGTVFAHRAELDEVAVGTISPMAYMMFGFPSDVVDLGEDGVERSIIEYGADRCSAKWTSVPEAVTIS